MKPQTNDDINFTMVGCSLTVLDMNEIIQEGDFIRDTSPICLDSGGWDTTYKNEKWRGPMWHRVKDDFPGWIGRSYQDYLDFVNENEDKYYHMDYMIHEIVRVG